MTESQEHTHQKTTSATTGSASKRTDSATTGSASKRKEKFAQKAASAVRGPVGRLPGLDMARAVAILGMVYAHIGGDTAPLWYVPDGFPSGLFAVLAGASMSVMMERGNRMGGRELAHARHRLLLRGALIFGIGMILDLVSTTIVVVLTSIAIIFLFLNPVTRWRTRNVIWLILAWTLLGPALVASSTYFGLFSEWLTNVYPVTAWMVYGLVGVLLHRFLVTQQNTWLGARTGGTPVQREESRARKNDLSAQGQRPQVQGDGSSANTLASLWRRRLAFPVILLVSAIIGAIGVWLRVQETSDQKAEMEQLMSAMKDDPDMDISYAMPSWGEEFLSFRAHSGGLGDVIFTSGMAVAVILLCTLICTPRIIALVLYPIRSLGAMSLTSYTAHVATAWLFTGIPLLPMLGQNSMSSSATEGSAEYANSISSAVPADAASSMSSSLPAGAMAGDGNWLNVVITIGVLLVFASVWRLFFQRGPMEAAVAFAERHGQRHDLEPRSR